MRLAARQCSDIHTRTAKQAPHVAGLYRLFRLVKIEESLPCRGRLLHFVSGCGNEEKMAR